MLFEKLPTIDKLKKLFASKKEIHTVLIFGSYAKNKERPDSDLDIGILTKDFKSIPWDYALKLSKQIDTIVNGPESEVILLNTASPHIAFRAIQEGKIIYQIHPKTLWNLFVVKTISMNEDLEILYRKVSHG